MSDQTIKKALNNSSRDELYNRLRSIWLTAIEDIIATIKTDPAYAGV